MCSVSTRAASTYSSQRSLQGALDVQQCGSVRLQLPMESAEAFSLRSRTTRNLEVSVIEGSTASIGLLLQSWTKYLEQ